MCEAVHLIPRCGTVALRLAAARSHRVCLRARARHAISMFHSRRNPSTCQEQFLSFIRWERFSANQDLSAISALSGFSANQDLSTI